MAQRQGRIKALITRNISDILTFELKNPKVGLPSVNHVEINSDNSLARVYVSFMGAKNPEKHIEELNRCKGFVRSSLAKRMDVYKVPDILFVYDTRFDDEERINSLLKKEEEDIQNAKKGSCD
ncbi:MAG: 30S ribosome-binding factor RbfA [Mollicutes bacterium]|nr:30S ribosome-binding factor RbfA [Mollicutes bacterium]MDD7043088.1 30S ribosome-binding factor RbfA [Mollicutes bacterium]MDY6070610.1 30S ribosome-binding factor RbfA [Bacilli bacterium]